MPPNPIDPRAPFHPVVVLGAGLVGLTAGLELAAYGVPSVILAEAVGDTGAVRWGKRSLDDLDRLGIAEVCLSKGTPWQPGRVFQGGVEVAAKDGLQEAMGKMPAGLALRERDIITELFAACQKSDLVDVRLNTRIDALDQSPERVALTVEMPEGPVNLDAAFVVVCDGSNSPVADLLGVKFDRDGTVERYLTADIEVDTPLQPTLWIDPEFYDGPFAQLHRLGSQNYRVDLQLAASTEMSNETHRALLARIVGHPDFRLLKTRTHSVQRGQLAQFVDGRVMFAGDSAHVAFPFDGDSGLQDVNALAWRLAAVVQGRAPKTLLQRYDVERGHAADLKSGAALPVQTSTPVVYPLDAPDVLGLPERACPGAAALDAPFEGGWLLEALRREFTLLAIGQAGPVVHGLATRRLEPTAKIRDLYLGEAEQALYLIRPDQIIAARWQDARADDIRKEIARIWEGAA